MSVSLRAYAAHRKSRGLTGGTLRAVQKALLDGRISLTSDNKIVPERADHEWESSTVGIYYPSSNKPVLADPSGMAKTYAIIRAARDANRLEIERLELATKRGTYVEVSKVRAEFEQILYVLRSEIEPIPARVKAQAPEMPHDTMILIERMVQQAMNNVMRYDPTA